MAAAAAPRAIPIARIVRLRRSARGLALPEQAPLNFETPPANPKPEPSEIRRPTMWRTASSRLCSTAGKQEPDYTDQPIFVAFGFRPSDFLRASVFVFLISLPMPPQLLTQSHPLVSAPIRPRRLRLQHGPRRGTATGRVAPGAAGAALLQLDRTGRLLWLLPEVCGDREDDTAAPAGATPHRRRPGTARRGLDLQPGVPAWRRLVCTERHGELPTDSRMDSRRVRPARRRHRAGSRMPQDPARPMLCGP